MKTYLPLRFQTSKIELYQCRQFDTRKQINLKNVFGHTSNLCLFTRGKMIHCVILKSLNMSGAKDMCVYIFILNLAMT